MSATLAERVLAGDEVVIREIVETCWPIRRLHFIGGSSDPAELRQAARVELIEIARAYDPATHGDFAEHARRRVRRLVDRLLYRERRNRARHQPLDELPEEQQPAAPELPAMPDPNPRLRRAVGRLSPRLRSVIVRLYYREMTTGEVAAEDGATLEAIERAHRRALARMKRDLRGPRTMPPC